MKVIAFSLSPTNFGSFFCQSIVVEEGRPLSSTQIENIEKIWSLVLIFFFLKNWKKKFITTENVSSFSIK